MSGRVLVTDPLAADGLAILKEGKLEVDVRTGLKGQDLLDAVKDYDALIVRSETRVTAEVIAAGKNLQIIGRAGVGVDNIDVDAATARGIIVVNAPTGNTVSAAELTFGLMMAMARNIAQADASTSRGVNGSASSTAPPSAAMAGTLNCTVAAEVAAKDGRTAYHST